MFEDPYTVVSFAPAPPGWRTVHLLNPPNLCKYAATVEGDELHGSQLCKTCFQPMGNNRHLGLRIASLAGWLTIEDRASHDREVVPASIQEGTLRPMPIGRWNQSAWLILGPSEEKPTAARVLAERERRAAEKALFQSTHVLAAR